MKHIFVILFVFLFTYSSAQKAIYYDKNKEYHYQAIYIDSKGDTITHETMIIKPLGKAWFVQPKQQDAVKYIYNSDTAGYKNYIDPEEFFHNKDKRYFKRKGKVRVDKEEVTGMAYTDTDFYMHPPRTNQYRMLFYVQHPNVKFNKLTDSITNCTGSLTIYGMGIFRHNNMITPIQKIKIENNQVRAWGINGKSIGEIKEKFKQEKIYNSTFNAIFTKEYGFVSIHYEFENGIKIKFDLEKIVRL
jgi:hypothetical protein